MITKEVCFAILEHMGYNKNCCGDCKSFVPDDLSGGISAKAAHCIYNPAIELSVEMRGHCNHFTKRTEVVKR